MIATDAQGTVVFDVRFYDMLAPTKKSLLLTQQRVEKGLGWLKESGQLYNMNVDRVDLDNFSVGDTSRCTLTQAAGPTAKGYCSATSVLRKARVIPPLDNYAWEKEHGFMEDWHEGIDYRMLTDAWREAIIVDREMAATA